MSEETCDHTTSKLTTTKWEDYDGETQIEEEWVTVPTSVDIDLHRYKCYQCDKVFYYSQAARLFFEDGITCNVPGLDKK